MKKILICLLILGLVGVVEIFNVNKNLAIENFLSNQQPIIINNSEPIIKISDDNYLEEFNIDLLNIRILEEGNKICRFTLTSKFKIELKRKKLEESLTNMWFKYLFLSRKYSEPNPYKEVGGWSSYYQGPYNYPYPIRYTKYSYNNNEIYWRDIYPESAYCWTHFEVNLKRGGTTWATYVNFKISGSQIIIETEPGTYPD